MRNLPHLYPCFRKVYHMLNDKFRRSKYHAENIKVKNIYPKGWLPLVFIIEMVLAILVVYYYKIVGNYVAVSICMGLFYIVALGEFMLRYVIKDKYFKNGYYMGIHSPYYHNKVRLLIASNIGMAIASSVHILIYDMTHTGTNFVYDNYWIWFALILFLICFEPFNDMTSGFLGTFFLTDRYVVDFSEISEIRIINEKVTTKGRVCEIEMYKGTLKVGKDRVFEEDLIQLKKIIANFI